MPDAIPYFFLAHLIDADGSRLASDEVWFEDGEAPDAKLAATTAAGFFVSDIHGLTEEEVEAATVRVFGPYIADPTAPAFEARVVEDDDASNGWSVA